MGKSKKFWTNENSTALNRQDYQSYYMSSRWQHECVLEIFQSGPKWCTNRPANRNPQLESHNYSKPEARLNDFISKLSTPSALKYDGLSNDPHIVTFHWHNNRNVCLLTYRPAATIKHYIPFRWD